MSRVASLFRTCSGSSDPFGWLWWFCGAWAYIGMLLQLGELDDHTSRTDHDRWKGEKKKEKMKEGDSS